MFGAGLCCEGSGEVKHEWSPLLRPLWAGMVKEVLVHFPTARARRAILERLRYIGNHHGEVGRMNSFFSCALEFYVLHIFMVHSAFCSS